MPKLAPLRHGESAWTKEYPFTGWTDVDLTPQGIEDAKLPPARTREKLFQFTRGQRSF